ncbi:hypothetical protein, partial [Flavobacterium sp.]|uniref:hypothetical protein n=1 Tax=Flavobacterium sp. TaxID=239 RepID=UPI0037BA0B56
MQRIAGHERSELAKQIAPKNTLSVGIKSINLRLKIYTKATMKNTALTHIHESLGAKMLPFA